MELELCRNRKRRSISSESLAGIIMEVIVARVFDAFSRDETNLCCMNHNWKAEVRNRNSERFCRKGSDHSNKWTDIFSHAPNDTLSAQRCLHRTSTSCSDISWQSSSRKYRILRSLRQQSCSMDWEIDLLSEYIFSSSALILVRWTGFATSTYFSLAPRNNLNLLMGIDFYKNINVICCTRGNAQVLTILLIFEQVTCWSQFHRSWSSS